MAKQKQEVGRKQLEREKERLEEEQSLQLEELEEENRRKLAEAKLTELELTDDLSQVTDEFHETLSRISKHSKQTTSQRVSDWDIEVNQPDSVSNQTQTKTVDLNNVPGSSNTAVIPESIDVVQKRQATLEMRSLADVNTGPGQSQDPPIGISSVPTILRPNSTPPALTAVNPLSFFQPSPVKTTTKTVSSVTVPVTMYPQVQSSVTPAATMTHVIPNLSAWTFPAPSSFPGVHAAVTKTA